ncbi:unnamed protein product [Cuscuta epithymum]|uniref:Uncharacterized protein n=1 Tax=Cuscuta epithymum TaxID=186058 RepID=A0AAV0FF58_9ASTE|nr:unnamed protein product [Cuscuta epithymum]
MKLHEAKAHHAAEKLQAKQAHLPAAAVTPHLTHGGGGEGHHGPAIGTVVPPTGTAAPAYPLGGHPHGHTRNI